MVIVASGIARGRVRMATTTTKATESSKMAGILQASYRQPAFVPHTPIWICFILKIISTFGEKGLISRHGTLTSSREIVEQME